LDSAVFLRNSSDYRPNWSTYRRRPAQARRLLEQAGCTIAANGIYACRGEPLSLRLVTTSGSDARTRTVELLKSQLLAIGVELAPAYAPLSVLLGQILPGGRWDVALFAWEASPRALRALHELYGCRGRLNWTGYCQRLVTGDLEQSDVIVDAKQRARVLNRADRRLALDVPVIPLFQSPLLAAFRAPVRGLVLNPGGDPTWNAEDWWLER
jgi:peptide/nickel transport system substrate-binding protein